MLNTILESFDIWTRSQTIKSNGRTAGVDNQRLLGIDKLRELILELAVRGKLVPQDLDDEAVVDYLEILSKKKDDFFKAKKVTNEKRSFQFDDNGKCPNGWVKVKLIDLAYPQPGFAFKSNFFNEVGDGLPLIRIRDVGQPFSGTFYSGNYNEEFLVNKGDFLISMDGEFRVAKWCGDKALLNQRVSRLLFYDNEIAKEFVVICLQIELKKIQGSKAYTTVDHLSGKQISGSVISLPPLAEQHRIVAKVDELMALCDQLEQQQTSTNATHHQLVELLLQNLTAATGPEAFATAWQRIATNFDTLFTTEYSIDQLKQTILQLAVMGKLVPQDPKDEPASELLKKIAREKERLVKEGKIKRQEKLPEITEEEKPFDLPRGWEWSYLSQITLLITDGKHGDCQNEEGSGYYFLSAKDVKNERLNYDFAREINYKEFLETHNRTDLKSGDICMVNTGATVGKLAIAPDDSRTNRTTFQKSVAVIKPVYNLVSSEYLKVFLLSEGEKFLKKSGGSAINNLLLGDLKKKVTPFPPLSEQHRIVAKVDELFALCDALKERIKEAQQTQEKLAEGVVDLQLK